MNDHPHSHHDPHQHEPRRAETPAPETPVDPGSQALAEALRSSFAIVKFLMIALVLVFLASGFFQVGPQEQAIILRFGKPVGEGRDALLEPGLHWSYPYPIDEYVKIPITELQSVRSTVGWFATTPAQEAAGTEPPAGPSLNPAVDGYAVTADGNIVHTRATLFFRIEDPVRYVFGFTNAQKVVQNALDNALVYTASRFVVDDIITRDVAGFRDAVTRQVAETLESYNVGVTVDHCEVQSIHPRQPQVRAAFENVLRAEVARTRVLNDARSYENQVISRAGADAQSIINLAELERVQLVNDIGSRATNFVSILPEYNKNPQLFVQRSLNEVLGRAVTNTERWVLPVAENGKSTEVRLLLNREPPRPRTGTQTQP